MEPNPKTAPMKIAMVSFYRRFFAAKIQHTSDTGNTVLQQHRRIGDTEDFCDHFSVHEALNEIFTIAVS